MGDRVAICTTCGAASALGTVSCASCGQPFPLADGVPTDAGAVAAIGEVDEVLPDQGAPSGGWGSGRVYDPAADRSRAVRWVFSRDWFGPLAALAAPTALLLGVALLLALHSDSLADQPYGDRLTGALATVVTAFGAPLRGTGGVDSLMVTEVTVRLVPLTVTLLWLLLLWLGLRTARRRDGRRLSLGQAAGMAARTALPAALVTAVLGLVASGSHGRAAGMYYGGAKVDQIGWPEAAVWTALGVGLLALTVYGTEALRWAAWQRPVLRGWLLSALLAVRTVAVPLGLGSVAAAVLTFVELPSEFAWPMLPEASNSGLFLIGIGSGATLESHNGFTDARTISLFDLNTASPLLWLAVLLPLAGALALGLTVHRRRLGPAEALRLALTHAVLLSLLMLVARQVVSFHVAMHPDADGTIPELPQSAPHSTEVTMGLAVVSLLIANPLWALLGTLGLPRLLTAVRGPAAPPVLDPESGFGPDSGFGPERGFGPDSGFGPSGETVPADAGTPEDSLVEVVPQSSVPYPADVLDSHADWARPRD